MEQDISENVEMFDIPLSTVSRMYRKCLMEGFTAHIGQLIFDHGSFLIVAGGNRLKLSLVTDRLY